MRQIWKYEISLGITILNIPSGGIVRHLGVQNDNAYIWVEIDPAKELVERKFSIYGTGWDLTEDVGTYVGSIQEGPFVWHLYEEKNAN